MFYIFVSDPETRVWWVPMSKKPGLGTAIGLTIAAYRRDNASRFGAALAFYIVFSIAPTLLIAIAIAGSLFGRVWAERTILDRIGGSFGSAAGIAIAAMIKSAAPRRAGWLATTIGITTLLFGLGGVYRQVDDALDRKDVVEGKRGDIG